ncbi:hypothetical protein JG688_00011870 [Phytophthora aleatoria]|uniref:Uncharacterized protein n=1 Tax=Phytophthora aleatoria TaxID=2496075 RepID=A0A8J5IG50_9STRA|nr:hypothetical protein JG688_00011870 [Phytophthora aleatoria]
MVANGSVNYWPELMITLANIRQADTLPAVPGLFVKEIGDVAVPLCAEQAEKLIAQCEKSPFGRKLDTMMNENVRKSWQPTSSQ